MQNSRRGSEDAAVRCLLCDPGGGGNHQHGDRISGIWAGLVSSQLRNFSGLTPRSIPRMGGSGRQQANIPVARARPGYFSVLYIAAYVCVLRSNFASPADPLLLVGREGTRVCRILQVSLPPSLPKSRARGRTGRTRCSRGAPSPSYPAAARRD